MMKDQSTAWVKNLRAKIKEVRRDIDATVSRVRLFSDPKQREHFTKAANGMLVQIDSLSNFFGGEKPPLVTELRDAARNWTSNLDHAPYARKVFGIYERLDELAEFEELSFEKIFNSYKDDGELQKLLDELIAALRKILEEGDEILSSQMARQLEVLLGEIERKKGKSITELTPWLDLLFATLAAAADLTCDTILFSTVLNAGKTAFQTRKQIYTLFLKARAQLLEQPALKNFRIPAKMGLLPAPDCSDEAAATFFNALGQPSKTPQGNQGELEVEKGKLVESQGPLDNLDQLVALLPESPVKREPEGELKQLSYNEAFNN